MVSYPHRPKSGHFTRYLNRTYHVLPTARTNAIEKSHGVVYPSHHADRI